MNSVIFDHGTSVHDTLTFRSDFDHSVATLDVTKEETSQRTYKLAVSYLGMNNDGRPEWYIKVNDSYPVFNFSREINDSSPNRVSFKLGFLGSKKLTFKPIEGNVVQLTETDEKDSKSLYLDPSTTPCTVSFEPVTIDGPIQSLLGEAMNSVIFDHGTSVHDTLNSVTFDHGTSVHDTLTFTSGLDHSSATLDVTKEETSQRTYKLAISYLGLDNDGRSEWNIKVNDSYPVFNFPGAVYDSISILPRPKVGFLNNKKLTFKPIEGNVVQLTATSEKGSTTLYLDLSTTPCTVSSEPVTIDGPIQSFNQS